MTPRLILLHTWTGEVYVNPQHITYIALDESGTIAIGLTSGDRVLATESLPLVLDALRAQA